MVAPIESKAWTDLLATSHKLFSSHDSVYSALINPNLDEDVASSPPENAPHETQVPVLSPCHSPAHGSPSRTPPAPSSLEPSAGLVDRCSPGSGWSTVNLPLDSSHDLARLLRLNSPFSCGSSRPASGSILSYSTDDDMISESLVMVPSVSKLKILLFDTDEEDNDGADEPSADDLIGRTLARIDDDDETLAPASETKSAPLFAGSHNLYHLFVMPKMVLSQACAKFQLTILSALSEAMRQECVALTAMIEGAVRSSSLAARLHVSHLALRAAPLPLELGLMHNSNDLFLVNDGLLVLSEAIAAAARSVPPGSGMPKVTVINILTTNYFINLFDIIKNVTPVQIWRTITLKSNKLSEKIQVYLTGEISAAPRVLEGKSKRRNPKKRRPSKNVPCALSPAKSYKLLEASFQSELAASLMFSHVDPLNFASSLGLLRVLYHRVTCSLLADFPTSVRQLVLFCGFSLGLGMCVLLGTGTLARLGLQQYHHQKRLALAADMMPTIPLKFASDDLAAVLATDKFRVALVFFWGGVADGYKQIFETVAHGRLALSTAQWTSSLVREMRSLSGSVVAATRDGYDKSVLLFTSWIK